MEMQSAACMNLYIIELRQEWVCKKCQKRKMATWCRTIWESWLALAVFFCCVTGVFARNFCNWSQPQSHQCRLLPGRYSHTSNAILESKRIERNWMVRIWSSFWHGLFRGALAVSFREAMSFWVLSLRQAEQQCKADNPDATWQQGLRLSWCVKKKVPALCSLWPIYNQFFIWYHLCLGEVSKVELVTTMLTSYMCIYRDVEIKHIDIL